MTPAVPIALFGFIPLTLLLFALVQPRTAVIGAFVGGWLFLPMANYKLPGLPDYNKNIAIALAVALGITLFDTKRWFDFRGSWADVPVALFCATPFATSLSNGLGAWDGLSASFLTGVNWLLPYVIGRVYLGNPRGIAELLFGVVLGAIVYLPLCWFEIRFSPQLHRNIYGFHQHSFGQTKRWGGFRPMVFLPHGLSVGMWMCIAVLSALTIWLSATAKRYWSWSAGGWLCALAITSIACKSTGALLLTVIGAALLVAGRQWRLRLPVLILLAVAPLYMLTRGSGVWSGQQLVWLSGETLSDDRAWSLNVRIANETRLAEKAMERPLLGWGRWSRGRVFDEAGRDITITDGLWIIVLSQSGLVGLVGMTLAVMVPALLALRAYPPQVWDTRQGLIIACGTTILCVFLVDAILNASLNPVYMLLAGGLVGAWQQNPGTPPVSRARNGYRKQVTSRDVAEVALPAGYKRGFLRAQGQ